MKSDDLLLSVAPVLARLPWKIVYLGGSTTHLCITDPSAPEPQQTDDIDVVVDVRSLVQYHVELRESLRALGAKEDTSEDAPLCRWRINDFPIDVMSPEESILGFTNRWYPLALATSREVTLRDGTAIHVVHAPVFVATKLAAYLSRGKEDCLSSKDIEDVIAVFDGRPEIVDEFDPLPEDLRRFVVDELARLLADPNFRYAVEGYLQEAPARSDAVYRRINALVSTFHHSS